MGLGSLITSITGFFDKILAQVQTAAFTSTSLAIIQFLAIIFCAVRVYFALRQWSTEHHHDGGMASLAVAAIRENARIIAVSLLVAAIPGMLQSVATSVTSVTSGLADSVGTAGSGAMNAMGNGIQTIWDVQSTIQNNLAMDHPWLFDGGDGALGLNGTPGQSQLNNQIVDAQTVQAKLASLSAAAQGAIQNQIAQGQQLSKSSDPATQARGRALIASAQAAQQSLSNAQALAKSGSQVVQNQKGSSGGYGIPEALRTVTAGFTMGLSELLLLLKRCLAGIVAFLCIALPLLLAIAGAWKLLQAIISVMAQLVTFIAVITLATSFAAAVGPAAMLTFLSPRFDRYGHNIISFFLQALAAGVVMAAAVKIACAGLGNIIGLIASTSSDVMLQVVGSQGLLNTMYQGAIAGLGFLLAGFAMDFFAGLISKAPGVGAGVISGTFHP
jgi:hypothetical protein